MTNADLLPRRLRLDHATLGWNVVGTVVTCPARPATLVA